MSIIVVAAFSVSVRIDFQAGFVVEEGLATLAELWIDVAHSLQVFRFADRSHVDFATLDHGVRTRFGCCNRQDRFDNDL